MAAFFWIHGGANANWNTVGNWSATSGGVSNGATPSVTSDVTFDGAGASGNTASNISAIQSVLSLTFSSGYTQTLTLSANLTVAGNFTDNTAHSWAGASSLIISAASTITSNGKTFPGNVQFSGANIKTLSGDWTIGGQLTTNAATVMNSGTLNVGGGLSIGNPISGTSLINLTGGTWSGGSAISNNLTLGSGTTMAGLTSYNTGTLTSGAGITTTGSTLGLSGSATLNTAGTVWNNVTHTVSGGTITNNSLLTALGTLSFFSLANVTWAGSFGFTVGTLTDPATTSSNRTFAAGVTYTVTTALTMIQAKLSTIIAMKSGTPGTKAILTLLNASTICNVLADFTDIDASKGRPIITFNGVVTTCLNVFSQSNMIYRPITSFNRSGKRFGLTNINKAVIYQ